MQEDGGGQQDNADGQVDGGNPELQNGGGQDDGRGWPWNSRVILFPVPAATVEPLSTDGTLLTPLRAVDL